MSKGCKPLISLPKMVKDRTQSQLGIALHPAVVSRLFPPVSPCVPRLSLRWYPCLPRRFAPKLARFGGRLHSNSLRRFHQTGAKQRGRKRCGLKRGGLLPSRAVYSVPQCGSLQGLCWFSRRGSLFRRGGHFGDVFPEKRPVFKLSVGFQTGIDSVLGPKSQKKEGNRYLAANKDGRTPAHLSKGPRHAFDRAFRGR